MQVPAAATACILAGVLAACATPHPGPQGPAPPAIEAPQAAAEPAALREAVDRLLPRATGLKQARDGIDFYHAAKAEAWLLMAQAELRSSGEGLAARSAVDEARRLVEGLENDRPLALRTPLLRGATQVRPDFWQDAAVLKRHPQANCAGELIARYEVQLVWAGIRDYEDGTEKAQPYLMRAEEFLAAAQAVLRECETLMSLIKTAMRETIHRRRAQDEFLARAEDFDAAQAVIDAITAEVEGRLTRSPFIYRKAGPSPFRRELIVPFGAAGYVVLYEIEGGSSVNIVAVRHQLEDDNY